MTGKAGKSGAPRRNTNGFKHGSSVIGKRLTVGELHPKMLSVKREALAYRRELEAEVLAVKGTVSWMDAHYVDTASSATMAAGMCRWRLRHKLDDMAGKDIETSAMNILKAKGIRDEKTKIFRELRPMAGRAARHNVVLGQYAGYRDEPNVAPDSRTPTYAALKVFVDNWRWQGVPFYLRAGKRLTCRMTEIAISFQPIPLCLFGRRDVCQAIERNVLVIRIQPEEGISLRFATKTPGEDLAVSEATMDFSYARAFERPQPGAYEHLLLGCLRGDQTLFARDDGVELEWDLVTPILDEWESNPSAPVHIYEQGSAGPKEADELLARSGHSWRKIQ